MYEEYLKIEELNNSNGEDKKDGASYEEELLEAILGDETNGYNELYPETDITFEKFENRPKTEKEKNNKIKNDAAQEIRKNFNENPYY